MYSPTIWVYVVSASIHLTPVIRDVSTIRKHDRWSERIAEENSWLQTTACRKDRTEKYFVWSVFAQSAHWCDNCRLPNESFHRRLLCDPWRPRETNAAADYHLRFQVQLEWDGAGWRLQIGTLQCFIFAVTSTRQKHYRTFPESSSTWSEVARLSNVFDSLLGCIA